MSDFVIRSTDRDATSFRVYFDEIFLHETKNSPGEIAQDLLNRNLAHGDERFTVEHYTGRKMVDYTVASAASYSDKKTLQSLKHFSAHLPESINAGGGTSSRPSPAHSSSNERGFLGS